MFLKFVQNIFGLDISERNLRLVQLKKSGNKILLVSYNEIKVPAGVFKDNQIVKKDEIIQLIRKLISEVKGSKIYTKYVAVCLPEPKTFVKVIDLTYPKTKDVVTEIIEEAKKHIPYPLEKTYLDWQYVDEKSKDRIMIGVCPKEIVANYQDTLIKAGLFPIALEIEATAIARSLFPLNKKIPEPVMVLDLGASRTGLFIYQENYIPFSLSLNISSNDLTNWVKDKLQLTLEQAEAAKRKIGLHEDKAQGGLKRVLSEPLSKLAEQMREAKYFYYEHFPFQKEIKTVYLTGGGANLADLTQFLAAKTDLAATLANPRLNLTAGKIDLPAEAAQSYATAIGLALRVYQEK